MRPNEPGAIETRSVRYRQGQSTAPPPSFFIFGPERSGTTVLAFLLSGQPGLFCVNDSFVFRSFVDSVLLARPGSSKRVSGRGLAVLGLQVAKLAAHGDFAGRRSLRELFHRAQETYLLKAFPASHQIGESQIDRYVELLRHRYGRPNRVYDDFLVQYLQPLESAVRVFVEMEVVYLADLFSVPLVEIVNRFRPSDDDFIYGEKTPIHTVFGEWILELYPAAKALLVVRHPISNIASLYSRHRPLERALDLYERFTSAVLRLSGHPRVEVVRFEDLLTRSSEVMEYLVRFLGADSFDSSLPLMAYVKRDYTGAKLDNSRHPNPEDLLNAGLRRAIRRRFGPLFEAFTYD